MRTFLAAVTASSAALALATAAPSAAAAKLRALSDLVRVSVDPYHDAQAQHRTEVEPDTFSSGNTIVSVFQVGRVSTGGASNIGWATSSDGGATWRHGFLPGTTTNVGGRYQEVSDASVAYDAKHGVWLVSYLGLLNGSVVDVLASRSTNGGTVWANPIAVAASSTFYDKNWTVCDDTAASPHYGNCYTEYDGVNAGDAEHMRTSTDGGLTWGAERSPADGAHGLGGQPVVAPDGRVTVPFLSVDVNEERAFSSTNGGTSWSSSVKIATVQHHDVAGLEEATAHTKDTLRESPLPSAEIDGAGQVFVAWSDCSFRASCASNDIVTSTSTDGTTWSAATRVPIDAVTSTADHFAPGIGVDPSSSGSTARVALTYYFYPKAACTDATCQLKVGYVSSGNGGATWTAPRTLVGPMTLARLPQTTQGRMFGDYISTSVLAGGNAYPVFPVARKPSTSAFAVSMYAPVGGLPVG
jgi:hypothetical protein